MFNLAALVVAIVAGFLVGVLVNLLADYLPGRRQHRESIASPFASPSSLLPSPSFLPRSTRRPDHAAPVYMWSGTIAWLLRHRKIAEESYLGAHWPRRIAVEIGTAATFAWVITHYTLPNDWLFFGVCTPILILIAVIDSEHRWILTSTWLTLGIFAIAYNVLWPRLPFPVITRGALTLFGIGLALYLLGIVVQRTLRIGRTVFGIGDVWLMLLGGLLVGWPMAGLALLVTVFLAGIASIATVIENRVRSRRRRRTLAIPYAPYLVLGIAVFMYAPWLASGAMLVWLSRLHH